MMMNSTLKTLLILHKKHAPAGAALLDFIERKDEYIVLYSISGRYCIQHLNSSGLYGGRYYANYLAAWMDWMDFSGIR